MESIKVEEAYEKIVQKGNQEQIADADRAISIINQGMRGEIDAWAFNTICEGYIGKPYVNKKAVIEHILKSDNPYVLFIFGCIPGMPVKEFSKRLIEVGDCDFIAKYAIFGGNLLECIEFLKEKEEYMLLYIVSTQHQKSKKGILNKLVKWMDYKDEQQDSVVKIQVWRDLIADFADQM